MNQTGSDYCDNYNKYLMYLLNLIKVIFLFIYFQLLIYYYIKKKMSVALMLHRLRQTILFPSSVLFFGGEKRHMLVFKDAGLDAIENSISETYA